MVLDSGEGDLVWTGSEGLSLYFGRVGGVVGNSRLGQGLSARAAKGVGVGGGRPVCPCCCRWW